jgi:hypothetical protein
MPSFLLIIDLKTALYKAVFKLPILSYLIISFNDSIIDASEAIKLLIELFIVSDCSKLVKQAKPLTHSPSLSQQGVFGTKLGQTISGYTLVH